MSRPKAKMVKALVALFATRKSIETSFRNFAVNLEKAGEASTGIIFRKLIESDIVDKILDDSARVLAKSLSKADIEEIYAFFSSEVGGRYLEAVPLVQSQLSQLAENHISKAIAREIEKGNQE